MTDARLKGEWLTAAAHDELSDVAYRIFHNALMHCAEQGTDGALAKRELRFLYPSEVPSAALDELVEAGFWELTDAGGYQFIDWGGKLGQSTAAEVEGNRKRARERSQRYRDKKNGTETTPATSQGRGSTPATGDVTRDVRSDVTVHVGRTGQAGQDRVLPVHAKKLSAVESNCAAGRHKLLGDGTCMHCEHTANIDRLAVVASPGGAS